MISATIESGQPGQAATVVGMAAVNLFSEAPIVVSAGGTVLGTIVGTLTARLLSPGTVALSDPIALKIASIELAIRKALDQTAG